MVLPRLGHTWKTRVAPTDSPLKISTYMQVVPG